MHDATDRSGARLHWQSQLVLLMVLPAAGVWLAILILHLTARYAAVAAGLGAGAVLALLVWRVRAATGAGAVTGGLLMGCFCLTTPGWHSSAWPLLTMLTLTLTATHAGRGRKQQPGLIESRRGRSAAQVAANLGVAALAGTLINAHGQVMALTVLLAALCEAAADTLSSELGQVVGGEPRLITTLRVVPAGTDGGITLAGTALGVIGALLVAFDGAPSMQLPWSAAWIAAAAGVGGLFFDSLLGATLERAGLLNNDAVNFLSTVFAAVVALGVAASLP